MSLGITQKQAKPVTSTNMNTAYYRHLAEAILRSWEHPTSKLDHTYIFFNFGLVYGPDEHWPDTLVEGWAAGGMPDLDRSWPCQEKMEELVDACRRYLEETKV